MSYYPSYAPYPAPAPVPVAVPVPVIQRDPPRITSEEGPAPERPRGLWPTRYTLVFGTIVIVLTVAAIALAAVAPSVTGTSSSLVPSGWSKLYDDRPVAGQWSNPAGCDYSAHGLLITGSASTENCVFLPSAARDVTSGGFYVEATLGPAAPLADTEVGGILVGRRASVIAAVVDQSGAYRLCTLRCGTGSVDASGEATAWHANGYTPNVIGLRYLAESQTVTLFVNGQEVRSVTYTVGASSEIALGASSSGQLPVTHVAIYSAAG